MLSLGWELEELTERGTFELMYKSPVEMQMDRIEVSYLAVFRGGRIKRVVIDALGDLERSSIDSRRFAYFIYAPTQWFAVENVTCLNMTTANVF